MRNEIAATREAGHETFALAFHHGQVTAEEDTANRALAGRFVSVRRTSFPAASLRHPVAPYQVSSRLDAGPALREAIGWRPDLIICHHEWTLPAALQVTRAVPGVPVVLRAHNDELRYYRDLRRSGRGVRLAYYAAEYARVRRFLGAAGRFGIAEVWYMSADDVSSGWAHIPHRVIPPIMYTTPVDAGASAGAPTVLFVGSLDIPHAVAGLEWFLERAWPGIVSHVPDARFVVAGRRPSPQLVRAIEQTPGTKLLPNPETLDGVFAGARIFVNPVFSGSGVNLKLGEPMRRALPIVTTTVGARGLDGVSGSFGIADAPDGFARACAGLLADDVAWEAARAGLVATRTRYSAEAVGAAVGAAILGHARGAVPRQAMP